jgi:aminopeptidase YwaD
MRRHHLVEGAAYLSAFVLAFFLSGTPGSLLAQQNPPRPYGVPKPLLPAAVIDTLINEVSGEIPLNNERLLAPFEHKRSAEEYEKVFRESQIVYQKLREYGIKDCGIEEVPRALLSPMTWNAQSAELWMLEPERTKLIDLDDVPACLAEQSQTSDVTAELVYVGSGTGEECYQGKDVRGKIVLATGRAYSVHEMAVKKRGALGVVITWATNSDYDPDEVGRDTLARQFDPGAAGAVTPAFGFMVSARQGARLAALLADGRRVVLHAKCQTNYYPFRNEVVWALIRGSERPDEELILTAHLFEEKAYQGANDNISGSASILETARVLQKLVAEGAIPPLRRSVRFLWVDEDAGTLGYLMKYPELRKRIFANINQDMVGENLRLHGSSLHLVQTPFSRPSYLNDVLANFFEFVGETNRDNIVNRPIKFVKPILSLAGTRDPFAYHIDGFSGGSDHGIFLDGGIGIPAVQMGVWPDMWYHTNLDRPDKSDSTQLKRAAFIATASALFMAGASNAEALQLAGEVLSRGQGRIGLEERRAYALLSGGGRLTLAQDYKESRNILHQAFLREASALNSTTFFAKEDKSFVDHVAKMSKNLLKSEESALADLAAQYRMAASLLGVEAHEPTRTGEEKRLDALVPVRTKDMTGFFNGRDFLERLKGKTVPEYRLGRGEDFEVRNFIDGRRSILEIRDAVSAEFRPVPLVDVENYIKVLEIGGMVRLEKKPPA